MKALLAIALLAATAVAQTTTVRVNDPVSPGAPGDPLLSLDEAIRIANGTLPLSLLSVSERAQVTGSGATTTIEIDAAITPSIALRAPLTPVDGPAPGVDVAIHGVHGVPALSAVGLPLAMRIRSNHVEVTNLRFVGGATGIEADASVHSAMGRQMRLDGLIFVAQLQTGVKLSAAGMMGMTPVLLTHTTFLSGSTALDIDDRSRGGAVMVDVEHVRFENVARGVNIYIDATGSMTMCRLWRCKMPSGERLAVVRRGAASDQRLMFMVVAGEFATTEDAVDAQGTPLVETAIHVHASTFRPAAGKRAFLLGPQDARMDFHISENELHGDIEVAEGRLNRRLWAWNNVFYDGAFAVSNQGAPTSFRWNRFERCTIRALPANSAQFTHSSSEFVGCTLDGQAFGGRIYLENCVVDAATVVTGNVVQQFPAPSPWLARTSCSTDTPAIGGSLDLTLDLPPGMLGVWEIGLSNPRVVLTQEPWRDYALRTPTLLVPGIYALHSTLRIPVPMDPNLVGVELYCTATTAPHTGQTHVPVFNRPRGVHLTVAR